MSAATKIYLSYAREDQEFAKRLATTLKAQSVTAWMDVQRIRAGENWMGRVREGQKDSTGAVVVLSRAAASSHWMQSEISALLMREVADPKFAIYPAVIEDADVPVAFRDRQYADFRGSFDDGIRQLMAAIKAKGTKHRTTPKTQAEVKKHKATSIDIHVTQLQGDYAAGNLVLVCGAGVSSDAGMPSWGALLRILLTEMFGKSAADGKQEMMAEIFQESFRPSPLMVAQYLKNGFGKDFLESLRGALYRTQPRQSGLIDAIVELCRPQRAGQSLHSIITFNFDDLIEHNLEKNKIKFDSISGEGQRSRSSRLPIYHVHGFLPRSGTLGDVVFSEDAYHSQFIDAFSWSNLVQLNHLNQNRCLFVGLSLTDPNLRRLLDVAMRRSPDRTQFHYAFKKRYDEPEILKSEAVRKLPAKDRYSIPDLIRIVERLEEQDANNLGLNVIWVDEYAEIPGILMRLASR